MKLATLKTEARDGALVVVDTARARYLPGRRVIATPPSSPTYLEEPTGEAVPSVEIELPDGRVVTSDDPNVSDLISQALGHEVTLEARRPATDLEHYRRARPIDDIELQVGFLRVLLLRTDHERHCSSSRTRAAGCLRRLRTQSAPSRPPAIR